MGLGIHGVSYVNMVSTGRGEFDYGVPADILLPYLSDSHGLHIFGRLMDVALTLVTYIATDSTYAMSVCFGPCDGDIHPFVLGAFLILAFFLRSNLSQWSRGRFPQPEVASLNPRYGSLFVGTLPLSWLGCLDVFVSWLYIVTLGCFILGLKVILLRGLVGCDH